MKQFSTNTAQYDWDLNMYVSPKVTLNTKLLNLIKTTVKIMCHLSTSVTDKSFRQVHMY